LARAVTEYWRAHHDDIANPSVDNRTGEVETAISFITATQWLKKLGFMSKEYCKAAMMAMNTMMYENIEMRFSYLF